MSRPRIPSCSPDISVRVIYFGFTVSVSRLKVYCVIYVSVSAVRKLVSKEGPDSAVTMAVN